MVLDKRAGIFYDIFTRKKAIVMRVEWRLVGKIMLNKVKYFLG
jgi:hypothetical protein